MQPAVITEDSDVLPELALYAVRWRLDLFPHYLSSFLFMRASIDLRKLGPCFVAHLAGNISVYVLYDFRACCRTVTTHPRTVFTD